jgi:hypothetical protein
MNEGEKMRYILLSLFLIGCNLEDPYKEKARNFAKDVCSCYKGLRSIHFYAYHFDFYCNDSKSKGINIQHGSEYYGEVCK